MKKFVLTVLVCLILIIPSANAEIFKDNEGFSYIVNPNYLIFTMGNKFCSTLDLSSIRIIVNNNSRFEFNAIDLVIRYNDESIVRRGITNFREDYRTGNIYVDGDLIDKYITGYDKNSREIYYKMKSAALSR